MAADYRLEAPPILRNFLSYHQTIKVHSPKTIEEYFLDLRMFFRYLNLSRNPELRKIPFDEITILNVDLDMIRSVTMTDVLDYLSFLSNERVGAHTNGLSAKSKARKQASLRSFYNYLTKTMHILEANPLLSLDSPKLKKTLPHYLSESESNRLLDAVTGAFEARDYCIILLFLSCGIRLSELTGLDLSDMMEDSIRIRGKGNKERILYLSDSCQEALDDYLLVRDSEHIEPEDKDALFISRNHRRINVRSVQKMVDKTLLRAGLDAAHFSPHKLRHTAATLMLQNGVDVRTLQDVLGHDNLNTTQIYTHVDNEGLRIAAAANPMSKRKKKTS
ncbi:MAG: tyrosine recombinase XerC [Evtepia sp.]